MQTYFFFGIPCAPDCPAAAVDMQLLSFRRKTRSLTLGRSPGLGYLGPVMINVSFDSPFENERRTSGELGTQPYAAEAGFEPARPGMPGLIQITQTHRPVGNKMMGK